MYADVNATKTSKQAEQILLVACGIFRGCDFKECAIILEKGLFFCSRSTQHLGQQQYINFDYHTSVSSVDCSYITKDRQANTQQ